MESHDYLRETTPLFPRRTRKKKRWEWIPSPETKNEA